MRNTKAIGLGTVLLSLVTCPVWSADRHVAAGHPGAADGASWETAFPTIQQALDAAGSNDVIRVKGGVYALESELVCAISFIRIEGGYEGAGTPGSNNPALWPTWITPSNGVSTRLLHLAAVTNVTLSRLGFRGGQTGADTRGGALLVTDAAGVLLDGCRVVSNLAFHASSQLAHGGGLYATNSTLVATNCTVRWNLAVATNHWNETRSLTAGGGGIYLAQSSAHLFNTDISDNAVTNVGRHATANIGFINIGGGLGLQGGELTARACTFRGNLNHVDNPSDNDPAAQGGGVAVTDGTAAFEACDFADNRAEGRAARGGGLFVNGGSMRLRGCRLWGNAVQGYNLYGGGIYQVYPATLQLENSLLVNNWPHNLYTSSGTIWLRNCTVADAVIGINSYAGAVYATNCIVARNGDDHCDSDAKRGTVLFSHCLLSPDETDYTAAPDSIVGGPGFERGYYLADDSPCIDGGFGTADVWLGAGSTTRTDGQPDTGPTDIGYHQPQAFTSPSADLYVAPDGDDGNDGLAPGAARALRSISRALERATTGTRVHIAAGRYDHMTESFPLPINQWGVQLIGTNRCRTILDATGADRSIIQMSRTGGDALLQDLTLTGANHDRAIASTPLYGGAVLMDLAACTVQHCVVSNNTVRNASYFGYGGGFALLASVLTINDSQVCGNLATGSRGYGGGVYNRDGSVCATRTVFSMNRAIGSTSYGGGLYLNAPTRTVRNRLQNGLVVHNEASSAGNGIYLAFAGLDLDACTLACNAGDGIYNHNSTVTAINSIFWDNGDDYAVRSGYTPVDKVTYCRVADGDFSGQDGNVHLDPGFDDTTYFHLQSRQGNYAGGHFDGGGWIRARAQSELIDRGDPLSEVADEPAPNGRRINLGAYGGTDVASLTLLGGSVIMIR